MTFSALRMTRMPFLRGKLQLLATRDDVMEINLSVIPRKSHDYFRHEARDLTCTVTADRKVPAKGAGVTIKMLIVSRARGVSL